MKTKTNLNKKPSQRTTRDSASSPKISKAKEKKAKPKLKAAALATAAIKEPPHQGKQLVELASSYCDELFSTPDQTGYARYPVNKHLENHPISSTEFKQWLTGLYYGKYKKPPSINSLKNALGVLQSNARFNGTVYEVHTRIAGLDDTVYIDTGDTNWGVIEISPKDGRYTTNPPVRFRRPQYMAVLPPPVGGGNINELRQFVNIGNDDDWILYVAFILSALRGRGPYPILIFIGGQGSAKSTTARVTKRVVDPVTAAALRN